MLATVFSMQGAAILTQGVIVMIVLSGFQYFIRLDKTYLDYVWRITLGLGTIPALFSLLLRRNLPETPRYTIEVDNDIERAYRDVDIVVDGKKRYNDHVRREGENRASLREVAGFIFGNRKQLMLLLAISIPRFALNVAFYGLSFNSNIILQSIGFGLTEDVYSNMFNSAVGQIIIVLLGSIPGYMYVKRFTWFL